MERIRTFEKKIVRNTKTQTNSNEGEALKEMLTFWEIYDRTFNTNHSEIIRNIYLNSNSFNQTEISLCMKFHVSENTLLRYRKRYIESFRACLIHSESNN